MKNKLCLVIKSYYPIINTIQLLISILFVFISIYNQNFLYGLISMTFSWQMGWMMSSKRFTFDEDENKYYNTDNKKYKEGQLIEIHRPFLSILKFVISLGLLIVGIKYRILIMGLLSLFICWNVGWNIKLKIYKSNEI